MVHALLDSESAAAAYRFTIRPGETHGLRHRGRRCSRACRSSGPGSRTLTSMYLLRAERPRRRRRLPPGGARFRRARDPERARRAALAPAEQSGRPAGQRLRRQQSARLRPDAAPARLSAPIEDLEARYEKRPSAWIEPIGDWGEGAVHLVEIPTSTEINDNIVAFWRPRKPTRAKGEYAYTYRIHWGARMPKPLPLAQAIATRIGAGPGRHAADRARFRGREPQGGRRRPTSRRRSRPTRARCATSCCSRTRRSAARG